jgi:hypothetical protein
MASSRRARTHDVAVKAEQSTARKSGSAPAQLPVSHLPSPQLAHLILAAATRTTRVHPVGSDKHGAATTVTRTVGRPTTSASSARQVGTRISPPVSPDARGAHAVVHAMPPVDAHPHAAAPPSPAAATTGVTHTEKKHGHKKLHAMHAVAAAGEATAEEQGGATAGSVPEMHGLGEEKKTKGKAKGGGEAAAGGEVAEAGGGSPGVAGVSLHMPEPPTTVSKGTARRIHGVQSRARATAHAKADLPHGEAQVSDARKAVDEPDKEALARAQAKLIQEVKAEPSPEIVKLCERIRQVIRDKRPPDEDALDTANPEEAATSAGNELNSTIGSETKKVQDNYGTIDQPPGGAGPAKGTELPSQPSVAATAPIHSAAATPDAVPDASVSLDADAAANKKKLHDAGMDTPVADLAQSGPVAEARGAQGELEQIAKEDPVKVLAGQKEALAKAEGDMATLQSQALTALTNSRAVTVKHASGKQHAMVGSEASQREQAATDAKTAFDEAKSQVDGLLKPLATGAMAEWEAAKEVMVSQFKADLAIVQQRVDDRHSGFGGFFTGIWDAVTGLPDWADEAYDRAETRFGDGVIAKLTEISIKVNSVIAACDMIIKNARDRIAKIFSDLPKSLQEWAAGEKTKFDQQLDQLHNEAIAARDNFNKELVSRSSAAVDEVRTEIAELRKKAMGLVGRIANAIGRFFADPVKFLVEALLDLLGIPPAAFWAVVAKIKKVIKDIIADPLTFAGNLLAGLAQGFGRFFDRFGEHMLRGFLTWLLGGLKDVQIPKEVTVKSIITFFMQLMGITWPNIRKILVKLVGPKNVALLEKAYSLVSFLVEQGPEGIYELIKEKLDPQSIVDQVVQLAVDYMVSAIIKQVTARVIALFNPVGAILAALEAIYRVLKWIFQNAAKIFTLIETIVNGMADILAGNVGSFAAAVEKGLELLIAPVIAFIADYFSLGDLPAIVADKVKSMRVWILGLIEKALTWIIEKGKALLAVVGIGKKDPSKKANKPEQEGVGEEIDFEADGESHRLWIALHGNRAEVMVASKTQSLAAYLNDVAEEAGNDPVAGPHIKAAREILRRLGPDADSVAMAAKRAAAPDEAAATDGGAGDGSQRQAKVVSEEEQLVTHLKVIFDLLNPIQKVIGENVDELDHAPFGYVFYQFREMRELKRARGFGGSDEKRFPQVHITFAGIIKLGKGTRRYDEQLIDTFNEAVALAKARLAMDEAPEFIGSPKSLTARLEATVAEKAEGSRKQMERFIDIVVGGNTVTGAEVDLGARRSVDHTLSVRRGDKFVRVAVEYKHWTGHLSQYRRKELTTRLRNQLHNQVVLVARGSQKFQELHIEWPEFDKLDDLSRANFLLVFLEVEAMGKQLGVDVLIFA